MPEFDPALYTMHYVYVMRNKKNKSLYIGYTSDLAHRVKQHKSEKDAELIYYEAFLSEKDARVRERKLKLYGSAWQGLKHRLDDTLGYKV